MADSVGPRISPQSPQAKLDEEPGSREHGSKARRGAWEAGSMGARLDDEESESWGAWEQG